MFSSEAHIYIPVTPPQSLTKSLASNLKLLSVSVSQYQSKVKSKPEPKMKSKEEMCLFFY